MKKKEDRRVKVTKKLLKESLINLLKTNDIKHISIRELCDKADVNRSTFYKHYDTQYELLNDVEEDFLSQIEFKIAKYKMNETEHMVNLLNYIEDNLELCRILINYNVDPEFPNKLFGLPSIQKKMEDALSTDQTEFGSAKLEYYFIYIVNGGFSILKHWINKNNRESALEIAEIILGLFSQLAPNA